MPAACIRRIGRPIPDEAFEPDLPPPARKQFDALIASIHATSGA